MWAIKPSLHSGLQHSSVGHLHDVSSRRQTSPFLLLPSVTPWAEESPSPVCSTEHTTKTSSLASLRSRDPKTRAHTVAIAFCNQFVTKLWGASCISACQSSLRKLNGAHSNCNWMQIKISLMRGLKSWKGRLHALSLRIWKMSENMLFLFRVRFCPLPPQQSE